MKTSLVALSLFVALASASGLVNAKGCVKGAAVGGVVGHVVGGHGVVGAAAGSPDRAARQGDKPGQTRIFGHAVNPDRDILI